MAPFKCKGCLLLIVNAIITGYSMLREYGNSEIHDHTCIDPSEVSSATYSSRAISIDDCRVR